MKEINHPAVVLAHADPDRSDALVRCLEARSVKVVGVAEDAGEALNLTERHRPDILVLGLDDADLDGGDAVAEIARLGLATRVVALDGRARRSRLLASFCSGVRACVSETDAESELPVAIAQVMRGYTYLSPNLTQDVIGPVHPNGSEQPAELSDREREILRYLARDVPKKEIVRDLELSHKDLASHRKAIMAKLRANHIGSLLRHAVRHQLAD